MVQKKKEHAVEHEKDAAHDERGKVELHENGEQEASDELELSAEWQDWVVENALEGATVAELVGDICACEKEGEGGDDTNKCKATVEKEVIRLVTSSGFRAAQSWRRRALRFKKVNALRVAYHRGHGPKEIERRANVSGEELRSSFLRFGQPVVLTDVSSSSPALQKWTDAYFVEKLGDLDVQFCKGRESQDRPNLNIKRFFQNAPLREVLRQIADLDVSNDLYLSGNNGFLALPETHFLVDDLDKSLEECLDHQGLKDSRPRASAFGSAQLAPARRCTTIQRRCFTCKYAGKNAFACSLPATNRH